MAPLKIYWSRRLSLTLQRSVAQAINIRMASLYAGPAGPTAADESDWPGAGSGKIYLNILNINKIYYLLFFFKKKLNIFEIGVASS